jgi:hypothetical protein
MNHELLSSKGDTFSAVLGPEQVVGKRIQSILLDKILNASEHDLVQAVVDEFTLNVPVLRDEDIYIADSGETQFDVRNDPMRLVMDKSRPYYVPATRTIIAVPFTGDAGFFHVRPQQFSLNIPRAEIANDEIRFTYVRTDQNVPALKQEYQQSVKTIKDHLRSLSESAAQFNGRLESLAAAQLKATGRKLLAREASGK